jgi:hypothetical protein
VDIGTGEAEENSECEFEFGDINPYIDDDVSTYLTDAAADQIIQDSQKSEPRVFCANATAPLELHFLVPLEHTPGEPVCICGPHGPMLVAVPRGVAPGEEATVRLGPNDTRSVTVPEGSQPGDEVDFENDRGEMVKVLVPPDKLPGDTFKVSPPSAMVQVPDGANPGDKVVFISPADGLNLSATVPSGASAGSYFAAFL